MPVPSLGRAKAKAQVKAKHKEEPKPLKVTKAQNKKANRAELDMVKGLSTLYRQDCADDLAFCKAELTNNPTYAPFLAMLLRRGTFEKMVTADAVRRKDEEKDQMFGSTRLPRKGTLVVPSLELVEQFLRTINTTFDVSAMAPVLKYSMYQYALQTNGLKFGTPTHDAFRYLKPCVYGLIDVYNRLGKRLNYDYSGGITLNDVKYWTLEGNTAKFTPTGEEVAFNYLGEGTDLEWAFSDPFAINCVMKSNKLAGSTVPLVESFAIPNAQSVWSNFTWANAELQMTSHVPTTAANAAVSS
jgi:hypothetical protein